MSRTCLLDFPTPALLEICWHVRDPTAFVVMMENLSVREKMKQFIHIFKDHSRDLTLLSQFRDFMCRPLSACPESFTINLVESSDAKCLDTKRLVERCQGRDSCQSIVCWTDMVNPEIIQLDQDDGFGFAVGGRNSYLYIPRNVVLLRARGPELRGLGALIDETRYDMWDRSSHIIAPNILHLELLDIGDSKELTGPLLPGVSPRLFTSTRCHTGVLRLVDLSQAEVVNVTAPDPNPTTDNYRNFDTVLGTNGIRGVSACKLSSISLPSATELTFKCAKLVHAIDAARLRKLMIQTIPVMYKTFVFKGASITNVNLPMLEEFELTVIGLLPKIRGFNVPNLERVKFEFQEALVPLHGQNVHNDMFKFEVPPSVSLVEYVSGLDKIDKSSLEGKVVRLLGEDTVL